MHASRKKEKKKKSMMIQWYTRKTFNNDSNTFKTQRQR